ncbi:MAG: baseplate J/gp47 family protein [Planctomycetia bacterium]|nr:baseplate J/gp47 family protein [Planctomycetia bacterium]
MIEVNSFDQIDVSTVTEYQQLLTQLIQEKYPGIDISRGVLHDLVLYLHAVLAARTSTELSRYKSAQSLLSISQDPTLAEESVADKVFSNYNITRKSATYSRGRVLLEFSENVSVLLPVNTRFYYNDETYITSSSVVIYSTNSGASDTLSQISHDVFGYYADVVAEVPGASSFIAKGTEFTTDSSFDNLIRITAAEDFTIGSDTESNAHVMQRLADGMATPCWGNRANIAALLLQNFPEMVDISVIGFGDAEMQRDKLTVFPISVGGRADIYVKTTPSVTALTVTEPATFLTMDKGLARWQLSTKALPGSYRVTDVRLEDKSCEIVKHTVTGIPHTADSKILVEFLSDSLVDDVNKDCLVTIVGQSDIDKVQAVLEDRALMPVTNDALVRAAWPAFVDVVVTITSKAGNEAAIRNTITNHINNTGFAGVITSVELARALGDVLTNDQQLYTLRLSSEVWGPDNLVYQASGCELAEAPNDPMRGVTSRTTVFYARSVTIEYT